nr:restriction endonuclease subunit S [Snodgrassella alvi]
MSSRSFIEKLLDGIEIEWNALWQVTTWDKRFNDVDNYKQPKVINYQYLLAADLFKLEKDNGDVFLLSTGERTGWTTEELAGAYLRTGEVVTIPGGKSRPIKDVLKYYKGRFVTADNRIATSSDTDKLLNKFLYYWLMSESTVIDGFYRGSGIQHPSMAAVLDMQIPIPPLHIQAEIVRILDTFTELISELISELAARKKQYNYYRDQLLSFKDGEVEWKTLGEVAKIQRGASPRPIAKYIVDDENGIPWIKIGDTSTGSKYVDRTAQKITFEGAKKSRILKKGDFIISNSMSFGRPYILNIDGAIHDGWASISDFENILNSDYLYHYLSSNSVQNYWISKINSGSVSNLNADIIKTLPVPVPSFSEQARIALILDKFDALTNSISEGLPREIALRQKQYEYYRNLLLSFPKPEEVAI